ncbi:MAG: IS256 family transposase [Clostridia bacterium]
MKENKNKELMNYILENYNAQSANDVAEALKDMFKDTIQGMMNAEFDSSMGYEKSDNKISKSNYRNGTSKKNIKSKFGEFELEVPRDRNNEFEPMIVPKHQRNISGIEDKIINLYARGLSTREISEEIEDIYGIEMSHTMVSNITDTIMPKIKEWQYRPLQSVYPIIFIDAVHFNVKEDNRIIKKAAYIVLGVTSDGFKDVLGIWIGENESAKFWLGTFNDLKNRGVKDVLIICSDGLTGIKEAITAAFPNAMQQRCIVHLIRNSVRFVSYKHLKEFCNDLKTIYQSIDEKQTKENLNIVKKKWLDKYPTSLKVWEDNWDAICTLFNYSKDLRKIMYTTNAIESLNRSYRKYTKTKGVFPNDDGLLKSLYLATMNIEKKWTTRYKNWDVIYNELSIFVK